MNQKPKLTAFLTMICCTAAGCWLPGCTAFKVQKDSYNSSTQQTVSKIVSATSKKLSSSLSPAVSRKLADMTLEQKIGQMFFLAFRKNADGTDFWTYNQAAHSTVQAIQPGGFVLFGENIHTTAQVRALIRRMKDDCRISPFVAVDQEGGKVQRIRHTDLISATDVPSMWDVGKTGNTELARQVGSVLGSELSVFGFNMDFAPDCDVFSNPNNKVIGTRSFSSNPQQAAIFSVALSEGLRSTGMIPVCKHFPGHGDTEADTHEGYASVDKTLDELKKTELIPFEEQIKAGAEMIMVAHISLPKVNGDETPASLSPKIIQGLLREELGFHGVIITDSLGMGAIAKHFSPGEAAVRAVKAGADILMLPSDPAAAYNTVLAAVKSGEISESRVDESVARILSLKKKYGLDSEKPLGSESLLGSAEHRRIVSQIQ